MDQNKVNGVDNTDSSIETPVRQLSMPKQTEINSESLVAEFECKFAVGQIVANYDDAYLLYCEYGRVKGFSVRKGKQSYFHGNSGELSMKEFECSCAGTKDPKRSAEGKPPNYQKLETRTGCKARLRIGRKKNEEWRVTIFDIEHNHDMAIADESYMLRSARNISYAKGATLKALVDAGFSVANAYSYMEQEAHGRENIGFSKKDAYDYLNRLERAHRQVEDGDAAELIRYCKNKSNEDPLFYWDFQVDEHNRMCNFFFRDGRSRIDYDAFGDVLSIDTTYKTNKYNLSCAPFTGINHHMHNVMFGIAFMSDETESSFKWLCKTFLESMSGKQPETIFTDQCQALMNSIDIEFPDSHHRLCQWHINQNAPSHFGCLNNNSGFKNMFRKCMEFCESEEEFEDIWGKMIVDYNLFDHSWLSNMYKLRQRWSTAFSRHRFSAGLKATSRSEGTNSTLKDGGKRTNTLFECVLRFEKVQNNWRRNEKEDDFDCRRGMPTLAVKTNYLLRNAAEIYTHKIYYKFQSQLLNSLGIDFDGLPLYRGTVAEFKVRSQGDSNRIQKVEFDMESHDIKCTCQYFEFVGILCEHSLLVFKQMNVHKIPTKYIKARWTKNVRNRISFGVPSHFTGEQESETVYVNHTMRLCYDLAMRSKVHPEARNLVKNELIGVLSNLKALLDKLNIDDLTTPTPVRMLEGPKVTNSDGIGENTIIDEHVHNPLYVKSRGVNNARVPNHWDSKSKRGKREKGNAGSSKRPTKISRKKVICSQISQGANQSPKVISQQQLQKVVTSQGASSMPSIQHDTTHHSQERQINLQSHSPQPLWLCPLPSSLGHGGQSSLGQRSSYILSQFSPNIVQYWNPNSSQGSFSSNERPPNFS